MADLVDLRVLTLPLYEMSEMTHLSPTRATVREIDVDVSNNEISIFFSRASFNVDINSYPNGLMGLLRDIRDDTFTYVDDPYPTNHDPLDPPSTQLSLQNEHVAYVIYKLSSKNWQFAHDYPPFTIGEDARDADIYFKARRFDPAGTSHRVDMGARVPKVENCSVAYFMADGEKAKGFTGLYVHALNIHVEIISGARRARTPIIIDPDVRYPGGSG